MHANFLSYQYTYPGVDFSSPLSCLMLYLKDTLNSVQTVSNIAWKNPSMHGKQDDVCGIHVYMWIQSTNHLFYFSIGIRELETYVKGFCNHSQ